MLPARARPKLAEVLVDMVDRATGHAECTSNSGGQCLACQQRLHAWQGIDCIFQLTARNVECSGRRDANQTGPKVDDIISSRVVRAQKQGWAALVEEYHGGAALRRKQVRKRIRAHREITVRTMTLVVALLQQRTSIARVWVALIGLVV